MVGSLLLSLLCLKPEIGSQETYPFFLCSSFWRAEGCSSSDTIHAGNCLCLRSSIRHQFSDRTRLPVSFYFIKRVTEIIYTIYQRSFNRFGIQKCECSSSLSVRRYAKRSFQPGTRKLGKQPENNMYRVVDEKHLYSMRTYHSSLESR